MAARSEEKSQTAIESIKQKTPNSRGKLEFLYLDLADLSKIKAAVEAFLAKETRLDVLFNNAGIMMSSTETTKTVQNYEAHLGINTIGTFLFTKLLTPILLATAEREPPNSVRVVWVSSGAAELYGPKPGGICMDNLDYRVPKSGLERYGTSKAGNYLHAVEFARRYKSSGIISLPVHPGNLDSELYRAQSTLNQLFLKYTILHSSIFGAYTELFAGLSSDVTIAQSGDWGKMLLYLS